MERNINLTIDHQCPQCGAPAELSETDRLVQCAYCKVKSFLAEKDYFRYLLPSNASDHQSLIYFPYWRFKGMLFACLPGGIEHRFLDVSRQAVATDLFPATVGLRSQTLQLRFVTAEASGRFIKPAQSFRRTMDAIISRVNGAPPRSILHQSHIGESQSLIYAPFYMHGDRLMDAVLHQPVSGDMDEAFADDHFTFVKADGHFRFVATLCPHCGWDMQGRRDTLILHCPNCASMWRPTRRSMQPVNVGCIESPTERDTIYMPFWRIQADVSGTALASYADLVRLANLPRAMQSGWDRIPFRFWCPAFKVRPRSFLRLLHQVTLIQPREGIRDRLPDGEMHPVNLPLSEAVETLKLNLAGLIRPKRAVQDGLANIDIHPNRYLLVYLPFHIRHHDLVQTHWNIAVNRNQLSLAGNL